MAKCPLCGGDKNLNCKVCRKFLIDKDKERERLQELERMFNNLRRSQSQGTGIESLDLAIRNEFGDWLRQPSPVYTSPIKDLYDQAFTEEKAGRIKQARLLYMKLHSLMEPTDRIHYRITRDSIFEKIKVLLKQQKAKR